MSENISAILTFYTSFLSLFWLNAPFSPKVFTNLQREDNTLIQIDFKCQFFFTLHLGQAKWRFSYSEHWKLNYVHIYTRAMFTHKNSMENTVERNLEKTCKENKSFATSKLLNMLFCRQSTVILPIADHDQQQTN